MNEFDGKHIGVLGIARSGLAAAEVLTEIGATVALYDSKSEEHLGAAAKAARKSAASVHMGGEPVDYGAIDLLITSPGVRRTAPVLTEAVAAGVPVIGEIEAAYRIMRAPLVAVTGTNGKTTTTVLIGEIVRAAGRKPYIAGNIAAGDLAMPLIRAAHLAEPDDVIVAEISSFQLEWIDRFRPKVAALLNITPDHGDRQTWGEYVASKWRIVENQTKDDYAVLRDDLAADAAEHGVKSNVLRFGPRDAAEQVGRILPLSQVLLPGRHNLENVAAAFAAAGALGIGADAMAEVGRSFSGVVHRLEHVAVCEGVTYINNSMCTNIDAFRRSLDAIDAPMVLIAGGVFKGDDPSPIARAVVEHDVAAVVLIGVSGPVLAKALHAAGYGRVILAGSMVEAVGEAHKLAQPNDTVMLAPACASFDMFLDFEDRGNQFKEAVRALCPTS